MAHMLSWWEKSVLLRPFDFVVLGAGLIGKQIAIKIKLRHPSARVALLDRSPISYGASTRNAGFACFGSVSEILDDFKRSSTDDVMNLLQKRHLGINKLREEFGEEYIGFRPTGSYEIFTDKTSAELALEGCDKINRMIEKVAGLKQTFEIKESKHLGMRTEEKCLFNSHEGMLNSGMLNETISDKAHRLGVIPLYGLNITGIRKSANACFLSSEQGIEVECNQLIIANNAFAKPYLPEEDIEPARGQIIISKPLENLPFDGIFHSDKGYIYFRSLGDRVLIGGGRNVFYNEENTFDMSGSEKVKLYLENYLREIVLPGRKIETEMHWSGIMAMGNEKLPLIKRVDDNMLICVRMSGMGVALGPVLSEELMHLI